MGNTRSHRRIHVLDEIRGLCVILMVIYHALYTVGYIFNIAFVRDLFHFFMPAEPFFAGVFVFICGVCCNLSRNNLKRGLLLAAAALGLSLALWFAVQAEFLHESSLIRFGILHCLAACILLYTLLRPTIRLIPAWLGVALCALLFFVSWHVPAENGGYFGINGLFEWHIPAAPTDTPFLYPFGLCPVSLAADYFPLIPWFFCFLTGYYVGTRHRSYPMWMFRSRFPLFSRIGKHAIWIYLAHQPAIYGLCYLISLLLS